jgi:hypothetical protein
MGASWLYVLDYVRARRVESSTVFFYPFARARLSVPNLVLMVMLVLVRVWMEVKV